MHGSSPFRSTLSTSYITPLYMCEVCTVTSHVWTCVKYVPKQVRTCVKYVPKSILGFSASAGNSASRLLGFAREFGFSASLLRPGIRLLGFSASPGNSASRLLGSPPFRGPPLPPPCSHGFNFSHHLFCLPCFRTFDCQSRPMAIEVSK